MRHALWFAALLAAPIGSATAQVCGNVQVNLTHAGQQPSGNTNSATLSANGRYVGWNTGSTNVVPGLSNTRADVFVTDLTTQQIELVSVSALGVEGNFDSWGQTLSSNGRLVAFFSAATNLLAAPQVHAGVYVRDLNAGVTERVDVTPAGAEPNERAKSGLRISATGRWVVFDSIATDLVAGGSNGQWQAYLRDRKAGATERISVSTAGALAAQHANGGDVSPDGRFVLFGSVAGNLVTGDGNGDFDVFLRDRAQGTTERVSLGGAGNELGGSSFAGSLSPDARYATFASNASDVVAGVPGGVFRTYVRDRVQGTTTLVSTGTAGTADGNCSSGHISACGGYVGFTSSATNLWPGNTNGLSDAYIRDLASGTTRMVSLKPDGTVPMAASYGAGFSADVRRVLMLSKSPNLTGVPDPNGNTDVFVQACALSAPRTYCQAEVNSLGCTPAIGSTGVPSASSGSGFFVTSSNTLSQRIGLFFYGLAGPRMTPFQGGLRCVESPIRRTPLRSSGGSPTIDCSGRFSIDFNAWVAGGADPALVASQAIWGQWWSRDAGSSSSTNLSDAITFDLAP